MSAIKYDVDKPRVDLLPPFALLEAAKALEFGAKKYGEHNWRKGLNWSRCIGSLLRHIYAFMSGEDNDQESGLPHLSHAMCNIMFLIEYTRSKPELDDRPGESE